MLDDPLERRWHVVHSEVRKRDGVARPSAALVHAQSGAAKVCFPTRAIVGPSLGELESEYPAPERKGALWVVGGKLDERGGHDAESKRAGYS
jgi:hypothetical protein